MQRRDQKLWEDKRLQARENLQFKREKLRNLCRQGREIMQPDVNIVGTVQRDLSREQRRAL